MSTNASGLTVILNLDPCDEKAEQKNDIRYAHISWRHLDVINC